MLPLFYECAIIQKLRNDLALFFEHDLTLFDLTPHAAFLGFYNVDSKLLLIKNHLLLIFTVHIYNSRGYESLILKSLIREITEVKNIVVRVLINNEKKHNVYKRKWQQVQNILKTKTICQFIWFGLWKRVG